MKVFLALSIILSGVLITENSYAQSVVSGSPLLQVSGLAINPAAHRENAFGKPDCPLAAHNGNKGGTKNQDSIVAGPLKSTR